MAQSLKTKVKPVRVLHQKGRVLRQQDPVLAVLQWGVSFMVGLALRMGVTVGQLRGLLADARGGGGGRQAAAAGRGL